MTGLNRPTHTLHFTADPPDVNYEHANSFSRSHYYKTALKSHQGVYKIRRYDFQKFDHKTTK